MEPISLCLAVLSTLFFSWLGYKYQERITVRFFLNRGTKNDQEVGMHFAPKYGLLAVVLFSMVFIAVVIGFTLAL